MCDCRLLIHSKYVSSSIVFFFNVVDSHVFHFLFRPANGRKMPFIWNRSSFWTRLLSTSLVRLLVEEKDTRLWLFPHFFPLIRLYRKRYPIPSTYFSSPSFCKKSRCCHCLLILLHFSELFNIQRFFYSLQNCMTNLLRK